MFITAAVHWAGPASAARVRLKSGDALTPTMQKSASAKYCRARPDGGRILAVVGKRREVAGSAGGRRWGRRRKR